jgi:hypothetical protein
MQYKHKDKKEEKNEPNVCGIRCQYCNIVNSNASVGKMSEKTMFSVMDTSGYSKCSQKKMIFCNPLCWINYRGTTDGIKWSLFNKWYEDNPELHQHHQRKFEVEFVDHKVEEID